MQPKPNSAKSTQDLLGTKSKLIWLPSPTKPTAAVILRIPDSSLFLLDRLFQYRLFTEVEQFMQSEMPRSAIQKLNSPTFAKFLFVTCLGFVIVSCGSHYLFGQDNAGQDNVEQGNTNGGETGQNSDIPDSLLEWTFQALGWTYSIVFLALSMTLLALIVSNIMAVMRNNICPTDLVDGIESNLAEGNAMGAAELARSDESFLGQVVTAGIGKLEKGFDRSIEAMQEVGEEETMKLEHRLSYLALIGNTAPMIGLLGTVQGMIKAFSTIARSTSTPKPSELAVGISTALFTTLIGLMIAIPAIAIYNILRNRSQKLVLEVGHTSEELLEKFHDSATA